MNPDFLDILQMLQEAGVRFVVVGAYAVGYHAQPRATGDIDILIEATPENGKLVLNALDRFGAPLQDLTLADLSQPGLIFQIGVPPRRIDIITQVSGVSFSEVWADKVTAVYGPLQVPLMGRKTLIQNKVASGRPKDLLDVDLLKKAKPNQD